MKLKDSILFYAVQRARHTGLMQFTREQVAKVAGCSEANVSYHFGTMEKLRAAVVDYAIEHETIEVLAQARALRHSSLGRMSAELRQRVADHIART
jgi:AcrR family transcriptional regulator